MPSQGPQKVGAVDVFTLLMGDPLPLYLKDHLTFSSRHQTHGSTPHTEVNLPLCNVSNKVTLVYTAVALTVCSSYLRFLVHGVKGRLGVRHQIDHGLYDLCQ